MAPFKALTGWLNLLIWLHLARATVFTDPSAVASKNYDFIVVGGGAAGNVIANRLTENANFSVLVIEAGISHDGVLPSIVPFLAASMEPQSAVTWNYTTVPQHSLNNRNLSYSRGKMLGGSSSINFLTYTRGSDDEYDRWANLTNDQGWSWSSVKQYYMKSSKLVPPADGHNTNGEADPSAHGNGPIEVSLPGFPFNIDDKVANASKELGGDFPFCVDLQAGKTVGFSYAQSTVGQSKRSSSATAYLDPALARPNLDVLVQTQVTRLLQSASPDARGPQFRTVEFAQSAQGEKFTLEAFKEVILSAGTINTPQVLMLSGIGNKTALQRFGITPVVNLPDVGQNLQDHPILSNYFSVNSDQTFDPVLRNATLAGELLTEWNTTGEGMFADAPGNSVGFVRFPSNSTVLKLFGDPSAGSKSAHAEMIFANGYAATVAPQPANGSFLTVNTAVVSPMSKGSITLASTDPFAFPNIDPGFFTHPFDIAAMVQVVKDVRTFVTASPWRGYIINRFGQMGNATTDTQIAAAARDNVVTIWHPVSTARMSPQNATWGVVDSNLLVKGVSGLRIVDASVFPAIPAAHTVGPVYIVAERAADLIKAAHR